jgi:hypothetical protein
MSFSDYNTGRVQVGTLGTPLPNFAILGDDFLTFNSDTSNGEYRIVTANSGAVTRLDQENGWLSIACSSTNASSGQIQQRSEPFKAKVGRTVNFRTKITIDQIASGIQVFAGLSVSTSTSNIFAGGAGNTSANHIGFELDAGVLSCVTEASGTRSSIVLALSTAALADDVELDLGFRVDDLTRIEYYVNNTSVGFLESNIPTTELAAIVSSFIATGDAAAEVAVDILIAGQTR